MNKPPLTNLRTFILPLVATTNIACSYWTRNTTPLPAPNNLHTHWRIKQDLVAWQNFDWPYPFLSRADNAPRAPIIFTLHKGQTLQVDSLRNYNTAISTFSETITFVTSGPHTGQTVLTNAILSAQGPYDDQAVEPLDPNSEPLPQPGPIQPSTRPRPPTP